MKPEELNFAKSEQNLTVMIPGKFAKGMRTNLIWQFIRFTIINVKMLIVVSKSH